MTTTNKKYNYVGFVEDYDVENLFHRLENGKIIRTRIVYCLGENKYLLRIYGYNLVMKSNVKFNRFDEVDVQIKQVSPKLIVQVVDKSRYTKLSNQHSGIMDVIV